MDISFFRSIHSKNNKKLWYIRFTTEVPSIDCGFELTTKELYSLLKKVNFIIKNKIPSSIIYIPNEKLKATFYIEITFNEAENLKKLIKRERFR